MPIGTVDYVSTIPWNDPYNPWPAYSTVALSGTVVVGAQTIIVNPATARMSITNFDPILDDGIPLGYANADYSIYMSYYKNEGTPAGWFMSLSGFEIRDYPNASKDVPYITVAGATGTWVEDAGTGLSSLLMFPVTTDITPWEHRRRWCLNG
jgi:hypothetical protein